MASRDHEDRDWDGWQRDRGGDDRQVRSGQGYGPQDDGRGGRQWSQSDDRSGGHDRRDQRVGSGGNQGGGFGAGGFGGPRGGMSQSGGDYERGEQGSLGSGSMGGRVFRDDGRDGGRGRQAQADMGANRGYDNFGGGAFRQGAEFAASQSRAGQGAEPGYGRGDEERFGRPRGAAGAAFGSGERDYGDYRTDRDRSLLGELASMLGFGGAARGDDQDRGGQGFATGRSQGPDQGRGQAHGQGMGQGVGQGMGQPGPRRGLGPRNYVRSDARIEEDVNEHLSHGHLDATDVEVAVQGGEVTLSGTVRSRQDKRLAEDIAHDVSGVRHVQNNLRVQDNWTGGGMTPGMGGGQGAGPGGSAGASSAGPSGASMGASMGSVVGSSGSATNVTTGQDPRQMVGQSSGQSSAEGGSLGTSQAGSQSSKPEPGRL